MNVKRIIDFIFCFILMMILSPVFIIVSVIIKLTSKGPIIFKQRRIGKDKKEFDIYKFRTMYSEAPKDVATHMLENPARFITPIGKLLRKTSLDELPQLVNILKGEMSFVGPRPALYNQYDLIALRDEHRINSIIPGLTGWAQVNGRDELLLSVKVEYDKYYVEHWSLLLDIKIFFMTAFSVVASKGVVEGKQESKEHMKV